MNSLKIREIEKLKYLILLLLSKFSRYSFIFQKKRIQNYQLYPSYLFIVVLLSIIKYGIRIIVDCKIIIIIFLVCKV